MIKIAINYEYEIPEKTEAYDKSKIEIINSLMKEKENMKFYLLEKQAEINKAIDFLIKGSNITEAESFVKEVLSEDEYEHFKYIGESRQDKINKIYLSYREILQGIKTFLMLEENNIFEGEEHKIELIKSELKFDIKQLNEYFLSSSYNVEINLDNLFIDIDYYELDVCKIIKEIRRSSTFKIVK